jgi:putative transposase
VQRLWREEGLRVPVRRRKRQRLGDSTEPAERLRAARPNHVWALDFQHDQTADGRVIRLLNVVDEFTREALEMLVERSINADTTVGLLERLVAERGAPEHLRMDNGPELTAHALQDWCRFSKAGTAYIDPGSPWQNLFVESFHSRVRDELLDVEEFSSLAEAKVVISDWREDYNLRRPHSALRMRTPAAFAVEWATTNTGCRPPREATPSSLGCPGERAATIVASPSRLRRSARDDGRAPLPRYLTAGA